MDFEIILTGLNHRTANVALREQFNLSNFCTTDAWPIRHENGLQESLILSTCNRVEILGIGNPDSENAILSQWASTCNASLKELKNYVYIYKGQEAIKHVFQVAASLDSMVLGEPQILGQLKGAYRAAANSRKAGPIINRLMHMAFTVGKRVRSETAVAESAVSVSYAAVELARKIFGALQGHQAVLLGAGEMAELAARHLLQAGIDRLLVLNRTFANGQELAKKFHAEVQPFENLQNCLAEADIVICSTGSQDPIIKPEHMVKALKKRKNSPMFLIDIAVPRDVDPLVNNFDNVYLYDIDDLKEVVEENQAGRREEAFKAESIITEETARFWRWLQNLDVKPTIIDLLHRGEELAKGEIAKTLRKLGPVTPEVREAIEQMAFALCRKYNHEPISYLKREGMNLGSPLVRVDVCRKIFNLDHQYPGRNQH